MRWYLAILNIINAFVFLWLITIFLSIFDIQEVIFTAGGDLVFGDLMESISHIFIYIIYFVSYGISLFSSFFVSAMFSPLPYYDFHYMFNFTGYFFKFYFSNWFSFPGGAAPEIYEVPVLLYNETLNFTANSYLIILQVLFLVSIIFAIRAIRENNPKINLTSVACLVLMIITPLIVFGFKKMIDLFAGNSALLMVITLILNGIYVGSIIVVPIIMVIVLAAAKKGKKYIIIYVLLLELSCLASVLTILEDPIDPTLTNLPVNDFFAFFSSPVALLAVVSYIYLEISFQINYADVVSKPALERKDRLEAQLTILKRESQTIVADVDKIKEEAKAKIEELQIEEKETIGGFFGKGAERFSYVKEMIRRKKLEEEEKKLITAASKTRRLGRYLERLFLEDPEAEDTLTAKTSAPQPKSLIRSIITTFTFRVCLLIIISYIIIHPKWFLTNVFQVPPAISESIVMYSPEVIIVLLGPLVILFPLISWIIQYIKHRNLIIRLKQEGRIKEILASVGDYVIIEKEEKKKEKPEETEIIAEEAT